MSQGRIQKAVALYICLSVGLCSFLHEASGFAPILSTKQVVTRCATATRTPTEDTLITSAFAEPKAETTLETKDVVTKVAVAGATGRTGRYVVEELLNRGVTSVVAVVRDIEKAAEIFPNPPANLEIVQCNLGDEKQIATVLKGVDAAIWCATGFSDSSDVDWLEKLKRLFGFAFAANQSIDVVGLPAFAKFISKQNSSGDSGAARLPKIVMCSSAGVTRTIWSKEKKETFIGCSDIPIVRLNPFGILDRKRESEEKLRECSVDYCIVRPCGLNDKWPAGSRPMLTQGDIAVGRLNRRDLATVLVDVLSAPEATEKTFEVVGIAGYPKPLSLGPSLSRLYKDSDAPDPSDDRLLFATYTAMQQLLPGERQDAAALAMGQTYEQLDQGETGRLGKKGKEDAEKVAPKPSS